MSGDRRKGSEDKSDWREGLKGLRSRLPSAPPSAPAGAGAGKKKPPTESASAPASPPAPAPDPAEEAALFERELGAQGVAKREGADAALRDLDQLPHAPGPAAGESRPAASASVPAPSSAPTRLKGDRRALAQRLDLHGYFLDDALAAVQTFLSQHRDLGSNEVRIITGHAERRASDAVLRPRVEALLATHPGVARSEPDGPGAFRVTLRPRRP